MEEILKKFDLVSFDLVMIAVFAILFTGFIRLMNTFVFGPYLALHQKRESSSTGRVEEAAELDAKAAKLTAQYEQGIGEARIQLMKEKAAALAKANAEAAALIAKADAEAAKIKREGREALGRELVATEQTLKNELPKFVESVSAKVQAIV